MRTGDGDITLSVQRERAPVPSPLACWRCGQVIKSTDLEALARCYELARGAV